MPIPAEFLTALVDSFGSRFRQNEPLSAHVTSRLGGPADVWLPVKRIDELVRAVVLARRYQVPFFVLGSGANLLITDAGLRGLIIENQVAAHQQYRVTLMRDCIYVIDIRPQFRDPESILVKSCLTGMI